MDFSSPLFIILCAHGVITFSAGFLMLKKPPKKINHLYGYRTKRSMSSQEKWDFAQQYSSHEMIRQGIVITGIGLVNLFLSVSEIVSVLIAITLIIFSVILLLFKTEKQLKQKFETDETLSRNTEV